MKFNELNKTAQIKAVKNYITGWKETHPNETLSITEVVRLCQDSKDDISYNINGEVEE